MADEGFINDKSVVGDEAVLAARRAAIAEIESRGQPNDGYSAVGPVANSAGNRAYGRYQVMDFNVPVWTKEVLGKAMSVQEFLADRKAQDAVFDAKFDEAARKYGGDENAARVWLGGPGALKNAGAKDVLGTSVEGYAKRFSQSMGGLAGKPTTVTGMADKYNTPLDEGEKAKFNQWMTDLSAREGRDISKDLPDYDLAGLFKAVDAELPDPGHMPDHFKKPSHPTFSKDSIYHGIDGHVGGEWGKDQETGKDMFTPGPTNLANGGVARIADYARNAEPNGLIINLGDRKMQIPGVSTPAGLG